MTKILEDWVIVRTYSAGVFFGQIESKENNRLIMRTSRRLWYWSGAASLSQLAMEGVKKPNECKFPCIVERCELFNVIEIINVTQAAKESIDAVPIWEVNND